MDPASGRWVVVDGSVVDLVDGYTERDTCRKREYHDPSRRWIVVDGSVVDGSVVDGSSYYSRETQIVVDGSIHLLLIHQIFERHADSSRWISGR